MEVEFDVWLSRERMRQPMRARRSQKGKFARDEPIRQSVKILQKRRMCFSVLAFHVLLF